MTPTPEQLMLVTTLPREEWGDGYLVLLKVLRYYNPERGPLRSFFLSSFRRWKVDGFRRTSRRFAHQLEDWGHPVHSGPADPPPPILHFFPFLSLHYGRGLSLQQIADLEEIPIGTVKSTMNRERQRARLLLLRESP
jgi:DNA-directed RNA polymerase specialized sigma24 family protein